MGCLTISDGLAITQIILIIIQIGVIIWVARQWRNQKRSERYADQCHRILLHWHNIYHYWSILIGTTPYIGGVKSHFEKFIEEEREFIRYLNAFLMDPDIYINEDDKVSMETIKVAGETYIEIKNIFDGYLKYLSGRDSSQEEDYCKYLHEHFYREKYERDPKSGEELLQINPTYKEKMDKYKNNIETMKKILKNYAHYKGKKCNWLGDLILKVKCRKTSLK